MKVCIQTLLYKEDAQGTTEYGIVLGGISIAAFGIVISLSEEIQDIYLRVINAVQTRFS